MRRIHSLFVYKSFANYLDSFIKESQFSLFQKNVPFFGCFVDINKMFFSHIHRVAEKQRYVIKKLVARALFSRSNTENKNVAKNGLKAVLQGCITKKSSFGLKRRNLTLVYKS